MHELSCKNLEKKEILMFLNAKHLVTLWTVGAAALATSCGSVGDDDKKSGKKIEETDTDLAGEWENSCTKADLFGINYNKTEVKFSPVGDFERETTLYSDEGCATPVGKMKETGTYAALGSSATVDGARDLNLTVSGAKLTAITQDAADKLNTARYCGVTNWTAGQEVDVLGKECLGLTRNNGDVVFDIYRVDQDNKRLTLGKPSLFFDKQRADARPEKLDDTNTYSKD
jgi:hypothetical protein